jgi:hypothetical protein
MKKENKNSQQRKKGMKVTLLLPKSDFFSNDDDLSRIELYMSATPDNWKKLIYLGNDGEDLQYLGTLFYHFAIRPGYEKYASYFDNPPLPRGIHAVDTGDPKDGTEAEFMTDSRNYIAAAMAVISYWVDTPEDEWPEFFKNIITDMKSSNIDILHKRNGQLVATKIVFALWIRTFRKRMIKQGLSGPKDLGTFRRRYINDNPRIEEAKVLFEKYGHHATIDDIVALFPEKSKFRIARPSLKFAKANYPNKMPKTV